MASIKSHQSSNVFADSRESVPGSVEHDAAMERFVRRFHLADGDIMLAEQAMKNQKPGSPDIARLIFRRLRT